MSKSRRCICTKGQGDAYYCPIHGGNGSWAALLKAAIESVRHCWDPDFARQVRVARKQLSADHTLAKKADAALKEV